jgi:hypothetical protein
MRSRRGNRKHNSDRFFGARLTDEERVECAAIMERLRKSNPARFEPTTSTLVVLKDTGEWKEAEGSVGDLICCIVRQGQEHTWMRRGKGQMKQGCRQALQVKKILWA